MTSDSLIVIVAVERHNTSRHDGLFGAGSNGGEGDLHTGFQHDVSQLHQSSYCYYYYYHNNYYHSSWWWWCCSSWSHCHCPRLLSLCCTRGLSLAVHAPPAPILTQASWQLQTCSSIPNQQKKI